MGGIGSKRRVQLPPRPISFWTQTLPNLTFQVTDSITIRPNLLNTFAVEYIVQNNTQVPSVKTTENSSLGFNADSNVFPVLSFGGSNGIGVAGTSTGVDAYFGYYAYHYQDTLYWNRGKHNLKLGGTFVARGMNATYGGNIETFNFSNMTGGPNDSTITPYVGSGFADAMLGDVYTANKAVENRNYPRQKYMAFFAQDDYKVTPKLTLNAGLRWDFYFRGHEAAGRAGRISTSRLTIQIGEIVWELGFLSQT
jgi:outer membrane receptor protein involved in Fe transport